MGLIYFIYLISTVPLAAKFEIPSPLTNIVQCKRALPLRARNPFTKWKKKFGCFHIQTGNCSPFNCQFIENVSDKMQVSSHTFAEQLELNFAVVPAAIEFKLTVAYTHTPRHGACSKQRQGCSRYNYDKTLNVVPECVANFAECCCTFYHT